MKISLSSAFALLAIATQPHQVVGSLRGLTTLGTTFDGGSAINPLPLIPCSATNKCPPINCIKAPCDFYVCESDGYCKLEQSDRADDSSQGDTDVDVGGEVCGSTTCAEDEFCCNVSCSQ